MGRRFVYDCFYTLPRINSEQTIFKTLEIFPWSRSVREKMRLFGIESFRSQQLETINITMSKLDVILIAATGSGKSKNNKINCYVY